MADLKFNLQKCFDLIEAVEDGEVNLQGTQIHLDEYNRPTATQGRESIRLLLKKFVIECKEKSEQSEHTFLKWLAWNEEHWRNQQGLVISRLNKKIETSPENEKSQLKAERKTYLDFFWNTYQLIKIIQEDIINGFLNSNVLSESEKKRLELEKQIHHYKEETWCIPFRALHHTIFTVCEFVKPICKDIEPLKYIHYFIHEIDFDKIDNDPEKKEALKYCNAMFEGLENVLRRDIDECILKFQNAVTELSTEQLNEAQRRIIATIGNLKRQTRDISTGESFMKRYTGLYKVFSEQNEIFSVHYQLLIANFNETILHDLLSSYEIINQTLNEISPTLRQLPIGKNNIEPQPEPEIKPTFKTEAIESIFNALKDYFSLPHQAQLKQILETGNDASEQLIFKDNGNRLTDTFKILFENSFITGCQKQELENWILKNFRYHYRGQVQVFQSSYLHKTISGNTTPCKTPLIEIENREISSAQRNKRRVEKTSWTCSFKPIRVL